MRHSIKWKILNVFTICLFGLLALSSCSSEGSKQQVSTLITLIASNPETPFFETVTPQRTMMSNSTIPETAVSATNAAIEPTVVKTLIPASSNTPNDIDDNYEDAIPGGFIYVFEEYVYGTLKPINKRQQITPIVPRNRENPPPWWAEDVDFAENENLLAYLLYDNSQLKLWVADLALNNVKLLWVDRNNIFQSKEKVQIKWGPGDKSVFVASKSKTIVVSLLNQKTYNLKNLCKEIGISPKTNYWALVCPNDDTTNHNLIIEQNGDIWSTLDTLQPPVVQVIDWAFSPNNFSVVFADSVSQVYIATRDKEIVPINGVKYSRPLSDTYMRVLQWAVDSKTMLVYGQSPDKRCPADPQVEISCWMIIDLAGKIKWPEVGYAGVAANHSDATLSPDGKWIALSILELPDNNPPDRYVAIISTLNNHLYKLSFWEVDGIRWIK
jgi:hypothetical protein